MASEMSQRDHGRRSTFSIVTVVFNDLSGLKATRASIGAQSFSDFEWVVIDGASTDGTAEYLAELERNRDAGRSSGLRTLSEPDRGIYAAMNKGLALCTGEYISFMNAGDTFAGPTVLEELARLAGAGEYDFLYGDALEHDGASLLLKRARNIDAIRYSMFTHHQAMLYRRQFVAEHGIRFDERMRIGGDYAFTAEVYVKGCRALRVPFPICVFERGGASHRLEAIGRREVLEVQRKILGLGPVRLLVNGIGFRLSSFFRANFRAAYDALRFRRRHGDPSR